MQKLALFQLVDFPKVKDFLFFLFCNIFDLGTAVDANVGEETRPGPEGGSMLCSDYFN